MTDSIRERFLSSPIAQRLLERGETENLNEMWVKLYGHVSLEVSSEPQDARMNQGT